MRRGGGGHLTSKHCRRCYSGQAGENIISSGSKGGSLLGLFEEKLQVKCKRKKIFDAVFEFE